MADVRLTNWVRITPRCATVDPGIGLAARLADPLWALARQLQLGEFTGDDGGTPTHIEVATTWVPLTHWSAGAPAADGTTNWQPYDRDRPLEPQVEDDRAVLGGQAPPLLSVVEAGRRLTRQLQRRGLGQLVDNAALPRVLRSPSSSALTLGVHADATIDGFAVKGSIGTIRGALAAGLDAAAATTLNGVLDEWLAWFERRFGTPQHDSSWSDDRLEHRFSMAAPDPAGGTLVLRAPEYLGDGVAWSSLELAPGAPGPAVMPADPAKQFVVKAPYPQPLRWPGMPVDRFWEMEDATVDLGTVRLDPADLPGLLALDMAVTASTDWFVIEVPLPGAGLARIDTITIHDTFGRATTVIGGPLAPIDLPGLGLLYAPSAMDRTGGGWLVMAPRLGARVDGPTREEIFLVRDEMANLGWVVEKIGPVVDGEPGELRGSPPFVDQPSPDGSLAYRLSSDTPDHWYPLIPARLEQARFFRLGSVFNQTNPLPTTMLARHIDTLRDEEVPREGKRLGRAWQSGRWFDGSRHLWSGRTVGAGRGEASSALRFDVTT